MFEDDAGLLDARFETPRATGDADVSAVSYAAGGGDRVTAWWVTPRTPGPHAGLVMAHWGFGSRDSFLAEAVALAASGVVSVLPNAPGYGGRRGPRVGFRRAEPARAYAAQAVRELRGAVELLASHGAVDAARIGFVGHSLGASLGAQLAAVEPRVRASVLVGGTGTLSTVWLSRASEAERQKLAPCDGVAWIGRSRAATFFQFADRDEFITRDDADAFVAAAPDPKRVERYACDHAFDDAARHDRAAWLRERLAFGPLDEPALSDAALPRRDRWRYRAIQPLLALAARGRR